MQHAFCQILGVNMLPSAWLSQATFLSSGLTKCKLLSSKVNELASSNDNACMKRVTWLAHSSTIDYFSSWLARSWKMLAIKPKQMKTRLLSCITLTKSSYLISTLIEARIHEISIETRMLYDIWCHNHWSDVHLEPCVPSRDLAQALPIFRAEIFFQCFIS